MNPQRVDQLIQFAVLAAGREDDPFDRALGPIHLIKYVYLADLIHAERHAGQTFTGVKWQFFHYGPWSPDVHDRIEPALRAIDADEKTIPSDYDSDLRRWSKVDDELFEEVEKALPVEVTSAIRKYVHNFGKDTAELLHFVYITPPMVRAAPKEFLVFEAAAPAPPPAGPASELSRKAEKKLEARLQETKAKVAEKLAKKKTEAASRKHAQPPRYDEEFFRGLTWLDSLAGEPVEETSGEVSFEDEIWTSPSRTQRRD